MREIGPTIERDIKVHYPTKCAGDAQSRDWWRKGGKGVMMHDIAQDDPLRREHNPCLRRADKDAVWRRHTIRTHEERLRICGLGCRTLGSSEQTRCRYKESKCVFHKVM